MQHARTLSVVATGIMVSGLGCCAVTRGPAVPEQAPPSFLLEEVRARVSGPGPSSIAVEQVGTGQMLDAILVAGGDFRVKPLPMNAVELRWPDRSVLIDPGSDQACSWPYALGLTLHADAYARMEEALVRADAIIATHEHYDHICALSTFHDLEAILPAIQLTEAQLRSTARASGFFQDGGALIRERAVPLRYSGLHEIAPGVVLIAAPGHTPGSQWVYIQAEDGTELLLVGDTAWSDQGIQEARSKPWLAIAFVGEVVTEQTHHIRFLHDLQRAEPELVILVAHDPDPWDAAIAAGHVSRGF